MMKLILSHYKRILGHNKINDLISPVSSYHHGDTFKLGFTLDHLTLWPCHGFTGTLRTVQNNSINASYIRIRLKWHHLKSATEGAALSMVGSRSLLSFLYNGHFRQTFRWICGYFGVQFQVVFILSWRSPAVSPAFVSWKLLYFGIKSNPVLI